MMARNSRFPAWRRFSWALIGCLCALSAQARNIDLATLPPRDSVQLTIYNGEDLTLARETRVLSFKPGRNALQFSWANTLIDPTSVHLEFQDAASAPRIVETTYPHDKPQTLTWQLESQHDGDATVEISYFTSGIVWRADYQLIASADETSLRLENFVRIENQSGEDYDQAEVRLVVGTINLVEKIADLAQQPAFDDRTEADEIRIKNQVKRRMRAMPRKMDHFVGLAAAAPVMEETAPKEVAKESLSEYYLFSIEGKETIPHGWSKRMRALLAETVPFTVEYRFRPREYGDSLQRFYLLTNDAPSQLGTAPLPAGSARVLRQDGPNGLRYLAQTELKYSPIGDRVELNLGPDPEVIFETQPQRHYRDNLWLKIHGASVYRQVDGLGVQVDPRSTVAGWDEHTVFQRRIRNQTPRDIRVAVRESWDGDIVFRGEATLFDYRTVEYPVEVSAGTRKTVQYEIIQRQGRNARQQRVELEAPSMP